MESFGHKMIISSQPVPLTGRGVFYPRVRDFYFIRTKFIRTSSLTFGQNLRTQYRWARNRPKLRTLLRLKFQKAIEAHPIFTASYKKKCTWCKPGMGTISSIQAVHIDLFYSVPDDSTFNFRYKI